MNDILFCRSFRFSVIRKSCPSHTDNSGGISSHFLARMIRGNARIVTEARQELRLEPGDVFYLPTGLRYNSYWYPDQGGEVSWESYRFKYLPVDTAVKYALQKLEPPSEACGIFDELISDPRITPRSVGLFYQIIGLCLPCMLVSDEDKGESVIERARAYISDNPCAAVGDIARHCGISESGLYSLFKRVAGMTPVDMKNLAKANRAAELLENTSMSVEEISRSLGFCNSSYFRSVLRRCVGKTPSQIRKEARQI